MSDLDKRGTEFKQTTVEEGTQFKGTLLSTCQVMIRGQVDGDLTAPSIVISETGTVIGNVKAQSIQSAGVLAGRVDADDIQLSGSVRSDTVIRAKTLEVKLQGNRKKLEITFGECILDVGDDPSADDEASDSKKTTSLARRSDSAVLEASALESKNNEGLSSS